MVDFGLKLEDNKVADWSENYIAYEKLKAILKKCEAAVKRYEELSQRQPDRAADIAFAYHHGACTPSSSRLDLGEESESRPSSSSNLAAQSELDEKTGLKEINTGRVPIDTPPPSLYGSTSDSLPTITPLVSTETIMKVIERAASGVTDFYSGRYVRLVRDSLKEIEKYEYEFGDCLLADVQKVNQFYNTKLYELRDQIAYLKDAVQPVKDFQMTSKLSDDFGSEKEDFIVTPMISSTARKSMPSPIVLVKAIANWTTGKMTGNENARHENRVSVDYSLVTSEKIDDDEIVDEETTKKLREGDSIQRALIDHYRTAKLLHNFAIINYTGFVKIVKKHEKILTKENKGKYKDAIVPANICNEGKEVEALALRMERLYAAWFCDKNISEARAQMLIKKGDSLEMDWSQLRLGYRMGMCAILALWVGWDCVWGLLSLGRSTIGGRTAFPVFRACAGLLQLQWCWGFSVWFWTRYRVNYIFLFDFDPNLVDTPLSIFNETVDNTLFYLVCTLLYYKAGAHAIPWPFPAGVFPFILVLYTLHKLIFPLRVRMPMWKSILKVVTTPAHSPSFFQGYVGDIFTSMVKVFQDLVWALFFVFTGDWLISEDSLQAAEHTWAKKGWYSHILIPLVTLLPLWVRFNQCMRRYADTGTRIPHLPNAFKYALSQLVTLFGAFHPLYMKSRAESNWFQGFWMFLFIASSLYSFSWDVFMDWGLGKRKYGFLAQRLMYPKRSMYYAIIAIDLVLRFAWVLTLLPPQSGAKFALPAYLTLVSMMLEIFRRTLWGFLRLENEHRSNAAGYRRVDFVPLHFTTGHKHGYKKEKTRDGLSVLLEVAGVTILVLGAAIVSVVAAQHATERDKTPDL